MRFAFWRLHSFPRWNQPNLARHDIPVELHKIDGMRLPFPDKSIDVFFTVIMLQHNTAEEMFRNLVREVCRVTKNAVIAMEDTGGRGAGETGDVDEIIEDKADLTKMVLHRKA